MSVYYSPKIKSRAAIKKIVAAIKRKKQRIVFTNGCFDIIHPGHAYYLAACRRYGDVLIVGLNADASVKRLKGPTRPIFPEKTRAYMLSQLASIDYIVIFSEDTPRELIARVRPDVLVKGGDYQGKTLAGEKIVRSYGGTIKLIPYLKGFSTTRVLNAITSGKCF